MGLGLTLVRQLVELHGGTVTARSAGPGCGSDFEVRLPLVEPTADEPAPPDAAAQLARLRDAHRTAQPLDLLAEAVGQGYVAKVRVASLEVSQGVGEVDRLDYACLLVEHVEPPRAPALDPLAAVDTGLLDDAEASRIREEADAKVEDAITFAKDSPEPDPATASSYVFA